MSGLIRETRCSVSMLSPDHQLPCTCGGSNARAGEHCVSNIQSSHCYTQRVVQVTTLTSYNYALHWLHQETYFSCSWILMLVSGYSIHECQVLKQMIVMLWAGEGFTADFSSVARSLATRGVAPVLTRPGELLKRLQWPPLVCYSAIMRFLLTFVRAGVWVVTSTTSEDFHASSCFYSCQYFWWSWRIKSEILWSRRKVWLKLYLSFYIHPENFSTVTVIANYTNDEVEKSVQRTQKCWLHKHYR